jgi:hypothetical protein
VGRGTRECWRLFILNSHSAQLHRHHWQVPLIWPSGVLSVHGALFQKGSLWSYIGSVSSIVVHAEAPSPCHRPDQSKR